VNDEAYMKLIQELLLSVHKDVTKLAADMQAVKVDLKEHMRRTAMNEVAIEYNRKNIYLAQGAVALVGFLATIATVWNRIHP
jgi:hypothetical protein